MIHLQHTTDDIRRQLATVLSAPEIDLAMPPIERINQLKKEHNAVILVHYYQIPSIYHGIADVVGDSLGLSQAATQVDADTIVFCGVHFMAETAKLLNPAKTVLIPDPTAGCSLSESITPEDVRRLKARHPGVPVVCYVNTAADIKAESDICCTSGNAARVVNSLPGNEIIFIPDEFLGRNVARETGKTVYTHPGRCMVHEQFTVDDIVAYRAQFPNIKVIAHPECSPDVVNASDYSGSTHGMVEYLKQHPTAQVMMITECSMAGNVKERFPGVEFKMPCTICPHMKKITLQNVIEALEKNQYVVDIPEGIAVPARHAVERMVTIGRG
jgi:quinolinate synthase